jgi:WS/DGAT/MGAT family acyltransferase
VKRLTGTDALFLSLETPAWHQHVGGLTILDPGGRKVTFDQVLDRIDASLPHAPKFRWKLRQVPFGIDRPVWVDDDEFDVRRHVRRIAVPSPGGARETAEVAGTLLSTQLERSRPLWELWFIEGLANGRVAILLKYHHALLDGVSGASLATVLMDLEPDAPPPAPPDHDTSAGSDPSNVALLGHSLGTVLGRPIGLARYVTGMAGKGMTLAERMRSDQETRALLRAPLTPFNAPVGPRRSLAFSSVALDDVRAVKGAHDVKVNDIVLALVGGALRSYLLGLGSLPDAPLVTAVPVSTRAEGDTAQDNQITNMFVSLATDVEDAVDRLLAIRTSSRSAKAMTAAVRARQIQSLGEVVSPLIIGTTIRTIYRTGLMTRMPMRINTLVSNVPGPPFPLYMCGAKVTGIFPSSIILEGVGLNVTVFSYEDRIDFGFHVDPDLVPDPWTIAEAVPEALGDLMTASSLGPPKPVEDPFGDTAPVARTA